MIDSYLCSLRLLLTAFVVFFSYLIRPLGSPCNLFSELLKRSAGFFRVDRPSGCFLLTEFRIDSCGFARTSGFQFLCLLRAYAFKFRLTLPRRRFKDVWVHRDHSIDWWEHQPISWSRLSIQRLDLHLAGSGGQFLQVRRALVGFLLGLGCF